LKKNIKNNPQFSIIVSNPPYAVDDCKRYIRNNNAQNDFDLYKHLTDNSKEIEALFIERTKQLLKKDGIAAIILPSSILSNGGIYTKTREILLKYFERKAVVELGSNTFMATGTNTVVLFLQKRNEQTQEKIQDSISKAFIQHKDLTIHGIENPVQKYLSTVWTSLDIADYWTLLDKQPNEKVQQHELFNEYQKKMKTLDDIIAREKEKFLYFILAYEQKLVIVKSGEKDIEKRFLGYGFSNRRGNE
jgi:type I restriction enzyme M protein